MAWHLTWTVESVSMPVAHGTGKEGWDFLVCIIHDWLALSILVFLT